MDDYASSLFFVCFFCQSWHRFLSNLVIIFFFMAKVAACASGFCFNMNLSPVLSGVAWLFKVLVWPTKKKGYL